jgi:hypothetical protein
MAEHPEVSIPVPASSGATDQPNAQQSGGPPPVPAGFSDTPPSAPPTPEGFSDTKPSTESGQPEESLLSKIGSGASNLLQGAGAGAISTVAGLGKLITDPIVKHIASPEAMQASDQNLKKLTAVENPTQMVGYGGENLMEFLMGDEALKGMSFAEKALQVGNISKILEKSPRLMKMLQMGVDVGKAATELGPEEQAAIKKSPMLARLVGTGMDAIRAGAVQAGQTTAKTGDVGEGVKQGAETAATAGVLGGAFNVLGRVAEKAGEAGKAVQEASAEGAKAPTSLELGQKVSDQINDAETKMHGDFESGIQKLKGDLGDQKVPYQGSPLQKAAQETLQGKTDAKGVLGSAFQGISGGSNESKTLLNSLTDPKSTGDLTIDELIQRRQQLGEKIGQLTKGATSSADRADVKVYQKLRDGIDDTIQSLAKQSGKPEASADYDALRAAYKDKVKLFQSPAMQAMSAPGVASETKLDNAAKYLLSGGNKLDKINTLSETIGEPAVKDLGKGIIQRQLADASSETGQINPAKFVKNFKQIDNLPPEVKEKLFDMGTAQAGLDKLAGDLKSAANYQKLVRAGVLSGAGAGGGAIHPALGGIGVMLGLAGSGDLGKATELLDKVANSPKLWSAFRTAGKIGATLEASPAARRIGTAAKYGAGNALGNILGGATEPLSQPEDQDQNVVYSNQ